MSEAGSFCYEFGSFRVEPRGRVLLRDGQPVQLTAKAFELLLVLIEQSGSVVEKDDLMSKVWPDTFVEENNLTVNMSVLRKALGETAGEGRYILTVAGRGYKFIAPVNKVRDRMDDETPADKELASPVEINDAPHRRGSSESKGSLWLSVAQLAAAVAGTGLYFWQKSKRTEAVNNVEAVKVEAVKVADVNVTEINVAEIRTIAVLPFKPLGADEDEYLGLGLADDLITKLSNVKQFVIRPTSAVRRYAGEGSKDALAAGRELNVEAVLEGSIRRSGERMRVTVQLVSVSDGRPLWAETFDENFTEIFAVQDSISQKLAGALALKLTGPQKQLITKQYTENRAAYQLYLRGRYFWNKRTLAGHQKAIEYFRQAIEEDPGYALAYAGLADCYLLMEGYTAGHTAADTYPKAKAFAERALQIDDSLAEAHTSLGKVYESLWLWQEAEKEYRRAIELSPNYPTAHHWYSRYLRRMRRYEESLVESQRAQELDPLSLPINGNLAIAYMVKGLVASFIEQARKIKEIDPNHPTMYAVLGLVYLREGRAVDALAELEKAVELSAREAEYLGYLGYGYAVLHRRAEAFAILEDLKRMYADREAVGQDLASVCAGLEERDLAFAWLEKDMQAHSGYAANIVYEPRFDSLRSDRRFMQLLRRMNLQV
jgi:DNA-binding winged-HTH domains